MVKHWIHIPSLFSMLMTQSQQNFRLPLGCLGDLRNCRGVVGLNKSIHTCTYFLNELW